MYKVPFKSPQPDINNFIRVIKDEFIPSSGVVMEYFIDEEVRREISIELLGLDWVEPLEDSNVQDKYLKNYIQFWYRMGYESLSYALYDNSDLIKAIFDKVGQIIYEFYKNVVEIFGIYAFFQGDDMGFKTATLISPQTLRKYVLPWHKRYAELAHEHNMLYLLHSCGNIEAVMDDLIENVEIDGKHSFEDEIIPVHKFYKKYPY